MCLTQQSFAIACMTAVRSRDFDHVSTFCQRAVVAASCSSEQNVLYARIFVKSVDVRKECIVCF